MSDNKTAYLITIGEHDINGVMADELEESLIYVGRLIERLNTNEKFIGKYIYVVEHMLTENGTYVKQDNLWSGRYLIEQ
jgi:hypothetical protein